RIVFDNADLSSSRGFVRNPRQSLWEFLFIKRP
ncbi:MAG: hypothetical protein ACJAR8_001840, partial [Bacteroidia bacterium]